MQSASVSDDTNDRIINAGRGAMVRADLFCAFFDFLLPRSWRACWDSLCIVSLGLILLMIFAIINSLNAKIE